MTVNAYRGRERENERKLRSLEGRYDKPGRPTRQATGDLAAVDDLLSANVIDIDHAELLRDRIKADYVRKEQIRQIDKWVARKATTFGIVAMVAFVLAALAGVLLAMWFVSLFQR
jgi:uncharacterized protein YqhQ